MDDLFGVLQPVALVVAWVVGLGLVAFVLLVALAHVRLWWWQRRQGGAR